MEKKILDKLHEAQIEILDEIVRICEKEKIEYFLFWGTLIGAVRHKGFIPWDDDIDIAMTRDNYNKFLSVVEDNLKEKFVLDSIKTNKQYYLPFIKIKNKNTQFIEKSNNNPDYKGNKGIWVDIFPLDYSKKGNTRYNRFRSKIILYIYYAMCLKNLNYKQKNKILFNILKIVPNKFLHFIYNLIIECDNNRYNYIIPFASISSIKNGVFLKEELSPARKLKFENKMYCVPNDYDKVLRKSYKDYMKLPPVEKRVTHNPKRVVFEDGEEIVFEKE